jgi:Dyp-type peroxidase family
VSDKEPPPIFLRDVQTGVVRGVNAQMVSYLFFHITDRQKFAAALPDGPDRVAELGNGLGVINGTFRSEAGRLDLQQRAKEAKPVRRRSRNNFDTLPFISYANVAFSYSGLQALGVHDATLATFPQPFCEGMAERAPLLGDKDDNAPAGWDGYLGSKEIHGVAWSSFQGMPQIRLKDLDAWYGELLSGLKNVFHFPLLPIVPSEKWPAKAAAGGPPFVINAIPGARVLHVEVGRANYEDHDVARRVEHFGFRDGISQPYADIGLGPPSPGGGTPRPGGTWAPLAIGELLLGHPDEDGRVQQLPANVELRTNGTYMVFRKLKQDVIRFRNFMDRHDRTGVDDGLAAQMVGRWPDGSPLVQSPDGPERVPSGGRKKTINDFRYQTDDPTGRRCPIGAHIRRANPRDTNNRDEARRHRLFRRSMSYGGALLGQEDDGIERGLLFISMQARIDRQFEHVQANWLGRGELVGQAGAHLDPLLAPHGGGTDAAFQPAGCPAPVTHLPRFVTTRGGDYFFVPSYSVLHGLKRGYNFPIDDTTAPLPEDALGSIIPSHTSDIAEHLIAGGFALLGAGLPPFGPPASTVTTPFPGGPPATLHTIVVGRWDYVTEVLNNDPDFSNAIFDQHSMAITGGQRLLIGLPRDDSERAKRLNVLHAALHRLGSMPIEPVVTAATRRVFDRVGPTGTLDVVGDLGRVVPIMAAGALFGVTGPGFISPTSIAALFGRIDGTDLPDDWLLVLPPLEDYAKPLATMQTWTRLSFLQIFVNLAQAQELLGLAERAARELLRHVDSLIVAARTAMASPPRTLLEALVLLPLDPTDLPDPTRHIRLLLTEFAVGAVETINAALANAIDQLLARKREVIEALVAYLGRRAPNEKTLDKLIGVLTDREVERLIFELLRFQPMGPLSFRICANPCGSTIGGQPVAAGTTVALVVQAAMMDPRVFPFPDTTRFDRPLNNYLHFGLGLHQCGGQYEIPMALPMLRILFKAIATQPRLRRAAGVLGKRQNVFPLLADGLTVRFDPQT